MELVRFCTGDLFWEKIREVHFSELIQKERKVGLAN